MHILSTVLPYLIGVSIAVVVVSLFAGLASMARGGAFNTRWGNRLMRTRVAAQGAALALLALYLVITRLV